MIIVIGVDSVTQAPRLHLRVHYSCFKWVYTQTHSCWYEHKTLPVKDTSKVTILWDFPTRTEGIIEANRPDIVIKHTQNKTCQLIDMKIWVCHQIAIFENFSLKQSLKKLANIKIWKLKLLRCEKWKQKPCQLLWGHLVWSKREHKNMLMKFQEICLQLKFKKIVLNNTAHVLRRILSL